MTDVKKRELLPVEEFVAGELRSLVKHEYLEGIVYATAGARNVHNIIATNSIVALGARLKDKPCHPINSATKIRVRLPTHHRFYYPDVSVICRPNPQDDSFQAEPAVIFEVLSQATGRIDWRRFTREWSSAQSKGSTTTSFPGFLSRVR